MLEIAYCVFCDRVENGKSEPHMTYSNYSNPLNARISAIEYAKWLSLKTGKVAEVILITKDQFWDSNWPITGQETPGQ